MPLELRPLSSASEVPEYISCYLEAFANPDSAFTHLAAPVYSTDPEARKDRVLGFSARQWFAHSADPSSHWFKVVDTDQNDKVVGGAKWNVYLEDPFKNGIPRASAYWWPPGPSKQYTEAVLNRLNEIRDRQKPHILCYYTFTHPDNRRRGAGNLMMEWATRKADELGLGIYVEASPMGSRLYTKHGFRITEVAELNPPRRSEEEENDPEWKSWRELTKGLRCAILKRPIRGDWSGQEENGIPPRGDLTRNGWEKTS